MVKLRRHIKDGEKFNLFTVIGYDDKLKKYIVKCKCGSIRKYSSISLKNSLINNKLKGCFNCTQFGERIERRKPDHLAAKKIVYLNYKAAAIKRHYEFNLSQEQFIKLIIQNCFYCNENPNMSLDYIKEKMHYNIFKYNGIDRVDNSIGYTIENCVPCCKICNNAKSTLTKQEWFDWIKKIVNHNNLV